LAAVLFLFELLAAIAPITMSTTITAATTPAAMRQPWVFLCWTNMICGGG
jgi:hypothetical protein